MTHTQIESLNDALVHVMEHRRVSVMVIGDFMLDRYIWGRCERVSQEAPVPVVRVQSETDCLGGPGNVVMNLYGLQVESLPVGVLGSDAAAERIRTHLSDVGCPLDWFVETPDRPTVQKTRILAQNQQVARVDREVTSPFEPEVYAQVKKHASAALDNADACIISDYGKGVCQPQLLRFVIDTARQRGVPVFVDPKGADFTRYAGASCITPNIAETDHVVRLSSTDDSAMAEAATCLRSDYHLDNVLITRSADGMTLLTEDAVYHIDAQAREVYDVSGAGDTVIAALAMGVACGLGYEWAARLANVVAGIVVGKLGTATVSLDELQHVIQSGGIQHTHSKVMPLRDLLRRVSVWRSERKKIVFTNGCFDLLHLGHITLLQKARELGDILIVALNSDASIRHLKGEGQPINRESDRALVLAGLGAVDAVVVYDEDTPVELLRLIQPDVLVKGANYRRQEIVGWEIVESYGGEVARIPIVEGHSSSGLVQKVRTSS